MKRTIYSLFLTALLCISGTQAWADDLTTTEIDGVTYYEIGTAADLVAFAQMVNGDADLEIPGQYNINAVLVNDIDLSSLATASDPITWEVPIGVITGEENKDVGPGAYTGIFDGQGHKISGLVAEGGAPGHMGLFGDTNGATIKNFSISGKLTATGGHGFGVIAYPVNSTITGIHSYLEIDVPDAGVCHVGGVVGSARGGNTITGCTFNGTLTIATGSTDCFGGVVGYGGDNISFCANYGTITFDDWGCAAGGVTGYANNANIYVRNCLNMGSLVYNYPEGAEEAEQTPKWGGAIVGRLRTHDLAKMTGNCWLEGSATGGGKDNDGKVNLTQAFCFTSDILPTGEICYKLNGDQTVIGWYQTLGTDEQPTLDATHAQVYMIGRKHCNGDLYEGYTFTNEPTEIIQDEHNMVNGICDYCGFFDMDVIANSMVLNDEGFYEIGNGPQLLWFAKYVNKEHPDANAILTADIDLAKMLSSNTWVPIGSESNKYIGTFDGQGHTITNFSLTTSATHAGLFGYIHTGAVIKNFTIYGTITSTGQRIGVIGSASGNATISGIHSYLDITATQTRHGGILGAQSANGTVNITRCIFSGTLTTINVGGNFGGMVGLTQNNTGARVNITDCLFDGTINIGTGDNAGGFVGYTRSCYCTIKNCLSVGTIIASNPGQFVGQINKISDSNPTSNMKLAGNNYYVDGNIQGAGTSEPASGSIDPEQATEGTLASGEVCWNLNEEKFFDSSWRQTLEVDPYPLPTGEGDYVYEFSTGLENISNDNIGEIISEFLTEENVFLNQIDYAYQTLIDAYKTEIDSWENIETVEAFFTSYYTALELKDSLITSAANYAAYVQACEDAAAAIIDNKLSGATTNILKTYLEEDVDPGDSYPNGSYSYIMDRCNLDDEAILAEITFVNKLLENAILAEGIIAGNEVTRLLKNMAFTEGEDGFEGWTTETDGPALDTGGTTEVMPIARGLGKGTFTISQTLTDLPNGIYMMTANSMFRSGADYTTQFYAGQLFMNSTANYVMSPVEDYIKVDLAEPGVNCLGDNGDAQYIVDDLLIGYMPKSMQGCSYAFNADRYLNFCATEVTDGTLTVGMRNLGTGMTNDWLPFGNLHIYYLGTAEQADTKGKLTQVLAGFKARAEVIQKFVPSESTEPVANYPKYAQYPAMSADLTNQLGEAIAAIDDAVTSEDKLNLINIFSDLFTKINACRKAYVEMEAAANYLIDFINDMYDADIISEDEFNEWEGLCYDAFDHYNFGDVSTEEALAIAKKLNEYNPLMTPVNGVYQIATAEDIKTFSLVVKVLDKAAKAVLTNDIDMSDVDDFEPIGNTDVPFQGEFDGKGHKITGFGSYNEEMGEYTLVFSNDASGFFGSVNGASIKNFSIEGTVEVVGGKYIGAIGQALKSTISNVHSSLNINVTAAGVRHTGGLVGSTEGDSGTTITGCSFSGTLKVAAGSTDNFAGILGYSGGDKVTNCANYGTITFSDAGCAAGGVVGYINNTNTAVQNCLNVGTVACDVSDSPKYGGAIVGRIKNNWASDKVTNNYWLAGSAYGPARKDDGSSPAAASAEGSTTEQLASGEVCYKLNGDQTKINWYQTLGADEFPVLYNTHKVVYFLEGTYTNDQAPTGTQDDPFIIKSAADLSNLITKLVSGRMNYVVMEDDVDMAGVTGWTPLFNIADQSNGYPFIDFDGKGHVISNLTSNAEGDYAYNGLFGILCGSVRNLGVKDADVTCAGGTGILAGYLGHSTFGQPCYVENVWVTGKVTANGYCGGMFGNVACESHFLNCYANVEVNGAGDLTGGIIGRVRAKIDMNQVYAAGSINRGGGIIGGGFQDATPAGTYNRVAVWNNTNNNFGPVRDSDELSGIIYYDGTNFADLQTKVVEWDSNVWSCDMQPGSYPVLAAFDPDGIKGVVADKSGQAISIYNLAGQRLEKLQKGINIVNGKKVLVK